jgi:hypothetical protein
MTNRNRLQWPGIAASASLIAIMAVAFAASPSSSMAQSNGPYTGCPAGFHRGGIQQTEGEGGTAYSARYGVQKTEGEGGTAYSAAHGVQKTEGEGGTAYSAAHGVQKTEGEGGTAYSAAHGVQKTEGEGGTAYSARYGVQKTALADMPCVPNH